MGSRQVDNLKELSYKVEAISSSAKQSTGVDGLLNLSLSQY